MKCRHLEYAVIALKMLFGRICDDNNLKPIGFVVNIFRMNTLLDGFQNNYEWIDIHSQKVRLVKNLLEVESLGELHNTIIFDSM